MLLSIAAEKGYNKVVKLLLESDGIDVNSKDGDDRTAMSCAAEKGHEAVVRLLLAKDGVDPNFKVYPLPLGWEEQKTIDGHAYYADHKTRTTTGENRYARARRR